MGGFLLRFSPRLVCGVESTWHTHTKVPRIVYCTSKVVIERVRLEALNGYRLRTASACAVRSKYAAYIRLLRMSGGFI